MLLAPDCVCSADWTCSAVPATRCACPALAATTDGNPTNSVVAAAEPEQLDHLPQTNLTDYSPRCHYCNSSPVVPWSFLPRMKRSYSGTARYWPFCTCTFDLGESGMPYSARFRGFVGAGLAFAGAVAAAVLRHGAGLYSRANSFVTIKNRNYSPQNNAQ